MLHRWFPLSLLLVSGGAAAQCDLQPLSISSDLIDMDGNPDPSGAAIGHDVAVSGDLIAVSGAFETLLPVLPATPFSGGVWILEQGPGGPVVVDKLSTTFSPTSTFGWQVEFAGDQVLVGDPGNCVLDCLEVGPEGKVHVFERGPDGWVETQILQAPQPDMNDVFGQHMVVDGDLLAVSALGDDHGITDTGRGAVHIFQNTPTGWVHRARVVSPAPSDFRFFGRGLDLSNGRLVATEEEQNFVGQFDGAAYVFDQGVDASEWIHVGTLLPPPGPLQPRFGAAAAVRGDRVVVSAPDGHQTMITFDWWDVEPAATGRGTALVYEQVAGSWKHTVTLAPPEVESTLAGGDFGDSLILGDDRLWVGDAYADRVYAFELGPVGWGVTDILRPSTDLGPGTAHKSAEFGAAMAREGDRMLVGAANAVVDGFAQHGLAFEIDLAGPRCSDFDLSGAPGVLSIVNGGRHVFSLHTGVPGGLYLVLGSLSGTTPGVPVGGLTVPLVQDAYSLITLAQAGQPPFLQTFGTLDAEGRAQAALDVARDTWPNLIGLDMHHAGLAFSTSGALLEVTQPVRLAFVD